MSRAPVGLFGLQIRIARVFGDTSASSAARSGRQRGRSPLRRRPVSGHGPDGGAKRPRELRPTACSSDIMTTARRRGWTRPPERNAVGLGPAVGDLHVLGRCGAVVHRRDERAQLRECRWSACRPACWPGEGRRGLPAVRQLVEPQRMHAAFGRFQATRCSQIDCSRSIANGSSFILESVPHR